MTPEQIKACIRAAFSDVERPPRWSLSGSNEGDEPVSLCEEFAQVPTWESLAPDFLNKTPKGYGSALSFFSDEAFRYYLPAYLIADLNNSLDRVDPVFHLTYGLGDSAHKRVNPRRYGARTFGDSARYRLSVFNSKQCDAIKAYLQYKAKRDDFNASSIRAALDNYWSGRASDR